MDDAERAAIFRAIEKTPRVDAPRAAHGAPASHPSRKWREAWADADAVHEARRCMTCGCRKSSCCTIRILAGEYGADVNRFAGARRRFSEDNTHPDIVYEPGKCISCDACVHIAAAEGEPFGMTMIGRGFDVRVGPPFGKPLQEALTRAARRCAEACPTGALSLRTGRACQCV